MWTARFAPIALFTGLLMTIPVISHTLSPTAKPFPKFVEQVLDNQFGIGYGVIVADINHDGKLDVVAINETQAVWFENPSWKKHLIMEGATKKDNVCLAAYDIDGDGRLDLAIGAEWMPTNTQSGGSLQWFRQPEDSSNRWSMIPIGSEPTLHRIRWADCRGRGKKELIVAPLQGRGTKPPNWGEGKGVRLMAFEMPSDPSNEAWKIEIIDESLHALHNFWVANYDDDPADEIITASLEGVFVFDRGKDGKWSKSQLGEGNDEENGVPGGGEIKMGKFKSGKRYLAAIEPWHGHQVVVYLPPAEAGSMWKRRVLDTKLKQGHAIWCADLDGDGDDELVMGWREAGDPELKPGIVIYDPQDEEWNSGKKYVVDDGGMATEDLTVADLNQDGFLDIIASGRATHNLKIYWNQGSGQ